MSVSIIDSSKPSPAKLARVSTSPGEAEACGAEKFSDTLDLSREHTSDGHKLDSSHRVTLHSTMAVVKVCRIVSQSRQTKSYKKPYSLTIKSIVSKPSTTNYGSVRYQGHTYKNSRWIRFRVYKGHLYEWNGYDLHWHELVGSHGRWKTVTRGWYGGSIAEALKIKPVKDALKTLACKFTRNVKCLIIDFLIKAEGFDILDDKNNKKMKLP